MSWATFTTKQRRCVSSSPLLFLLVLLSLGSIDAFSQNAAVRRRLVGVPLTSESSSRSPRSSSSSSRAAVVVPDALPWVVGSVVGGTFGVPVVYRGTSRWYRRIALPSWTPPDRVFGPVWTVLYASMGLAAFRARSRGASLALAWAHYAGNLAWAPVFFGAQRLRLACLLQLWLLGTLIIVTETFWRVDAVAACLLLPYAAWLAYAARLNQKICELNPTDKDGYNNARLENDVWKLRREAGRRVGV